MALEVRVGVPSCGSDSKAKVPNICGLVLYLFSLNVFMSFQVQWQKCNMAVLPPRIHKALWHPHISWPELCTSSWQPVELLTPDHQLCELRYDSWESCTFFACQVWNSRDLRFVNYAVNTFLDIILLSPSSWQIKLCSSFITLLVSSSFLMSPSRLVVRAFLPLPGQPSL